MGFDARDLYGRASAVARASVYDALRATLSALPTHLRPVARSNKRHVEWIDGLPHSGVWSDVPLRFDQKLPRCAYIYSHCDTISRRDEYVSELMRHFPVDAHGACLKNVQDDQAGVPLHYPRDLPRSVSLACGACSSCWHAGSE